MKTLNIILIFLFISTSGYSQNRIKKDTTQPDSSQYKLLKKVNVNKRTVSPMNTSKHSYKITPAKLYRPTRLGSSSPLYDTYKKNDYGAGAVTTNPHKSGRSFIYETPAHYLDSLDTKVKDSISLKKD